MKVLLIDVNCKQSSTGKIVYDLFSSINKRGHQAAVCYGRGPVIDEIGIFKFGLDWETRLHALLTRITGFTGYFSPFSTHRAIRFIKRFNPDIVHIHELHAYFVNLKPLLRFLAKINIPIVWTFHCEFMYTGKCGYAYECKKYVEKCGRCPQLRDYPKSLFFDWTRFMRKQKERMMADLKKLTIVTPSNWLADRVRMSFLKNRDIKVIHNGINTEIFFPRESDSLRKKIGIMSDQKVVLSVAPDIMSERKGGQWVLKLAEQFESQDVIFVLVGVSDLHIPHGNNVILVPLVKDQNELAEYYSLADVFVICSKSENLPTTCLEAQCCGTPICGFSVGGTAETSVLSTDYFVQYGDINAVKIHIDRILNSSILQQNMVLLGKNEFSKETMYHRYLRLYEDILNKERQI